MRDRRNCNSFTQCSQWWNAALGACLILLAALPGCRRANEKQPQLEHAEQIFVQGDLIRSQEEAERGYQYFHISNPLLAWKFRVLEAEALTWRGMSQQVLTLLEAIPSSVYSTLSVPTLTLEGIAHARLHHFKEAEEKLNQADQACAKPPATNCGAVLRAHGVLAMEETQYALAKKYFEQTLAAAGNDDRFLKSTALLNLGAAALQQAHFDEAIDWSQSALSLATELQARDIIQVALGNLGWAYYRLGNAEKALDMFDQATKTATELGDDLYELRWRTTAGYVYLDRQQYEQAEGAYSQALTLGDKINSREDIFNALISLALVAEQTNSLDHAEQSADRAINMAQADGNRADELYPLLVEGRVAAKRNDTGRAEHIFHEVADDAKSDVALKWEAEHALANLYEQAKHPADAEREYRAALKTFESARSELKQEDSALPFLTNASRIYADYVNFLVEHGKSAEALQVADFTRARTLAEGLGVLKKGSASSPSAINGEAIAKRAGSTILFYWLGDERSYLWAINGQRTKLFMLPSKGAINAAVERYQRALLGPQDALETANRDGALLYQELVAPAMSMMPKNGKVIVMPDGSLNGLNFETLLAGGPQMHYWIEDATISNASSLRLLGSTSATRKVGAALLLIGNPLAASQEYGSLPNAGLEMENIAKHFREGDRKVYAQEQATAAAYASSQPEQFSYIHFVAHGTASRTSPLDSAVVLSPHGAEGDSFKLYARDVIRHPLRAQLVTISTCYGAGTRAFAGEGLVGLSWAFLRAGAHNVAGALWEVNDTSTPQLMDKFYAGLTAGRSPDTALREAKLDFLHSSGAFRKPYYWAPFQLYTGQ